MATKMTGALNLSRIPKELIQKNKKGESVIYVDVMKNRDGEDKYGNVATITLYDKTSRKAIYLANLKEQELSGGHTTPSDDLPW